MSSAHIKVALSFPPGFEIQLVKVLTGNICTRDRDGLGEPEPCLWVEYEGGYKGWEPTRNITIEGDA